MTQLIQRVYYGRHQVSRCLWRIKFSWKHNKLQINYVTICTVFKRWEKNEVLLEWILKKYNMTFITVELLLIGYPVYRTPLYTRQIF